MSTFIPSTPETTSFSAQSSLKRTRILFTSTNPNSSNAAIAASSILPPLHDPMIHKASVLRKLRMRRFMFGSNDEETDLDLSKKISHSSSSTLKVLRELKGETLDLKGLAAAAGGTAKSNHNDKKHRPNSTAIIAASSLTNASASLKGLSGTRSSDSKGTLIVHRDKDDDDINTHSKRDSATAGGLLAALPSTKKRILTKSSTSTKIPSPKWHAPWRLSSVLSSHLGWVRSVAFDPTNDMFATGGADRVIKIFDLAKASVGRDDALKITLTGHVGPVRGLAFSERHPYLFSAGEDKQVKCWDLETNQVVRHYHGHLSGIFCLKLHPTLDVIVTGGRDAVARVWDMRSKTQIHCLAGHDNTVGAILTKSTDPQIITSSYDSTIKLWDIVAGKTMTTLTHHKKSVRALCQPSFESTFLSASADALKKWQHVDGRFLRSFTGHNAVVNAMTINDDGVVLSAGDDGSMKFWDYGSGYCFQETETVPQPGSLEAENGIYAAEFDGTGTRLITCEADKTIKIWKEDDESEESYPIDMVGWRKKCLKEAKQRY